MAKKRASFKSLPKRSKAAAFAKMSTAGKLKKKNKQGKRTGAAISAKGASAAKPKAKVTSKPKATSKAKPKTRMTAKPKVTNPIQLLDKKNRDATGAMKSFTRRLDENKWISDFKKSDAAQNRTFGFDAKANAKQETRQMISKMVPLFANKRERKKLIDWGMKKYGY
jgi:hypothetical protein